MVDLSAITQVGSTALMVVVIVVAIVIVGGITATITWFILKELRFKYKVIWLDKNNKTGGLDKGGIFVDRKTKNKRFFLKKNKVGLNPDNVPFKFIGKSMYVFLYRTGLKNFQYVDVNIDTNPGAIITVGEEDVNWAINAYERQKKLFSQTLLIQLLPYIAIAFVSIIILVIFIYFFKEFGTLREVAAKLSEAAQAIRDAELGTRVV